ncbi:uncharacterized protein LOC127703264 [Mytilus californianus]|uniref:uncharacterized protein LOC127703264 n=1 Tax=Mytilus californianus TaxID=6549 RepID=UPI002246C061|nr:uncharacterized protein LOC127703264 [Mytilus californianus]
MATNITNFLPLMCVLLFGRVASDLKIFSTKKITYGQDYLYIQFRSVQSSKTATVNRLIVQRNTTSAFVDILETDFNSITWKDSKMQERSCSEVLEGPCAKVMDIQIPKDKVIYTDTGIYKGTLELSDGSKLEEQAYIEVTGSVNAGNNIDCASLKFAVYIMGMNLLLHQL